MLGRQANQPPMKATLKSETSLTPKKDAQHRFLFTHWSTQAPEHQRHHAPKPQMGRMVFESVGKLCLGPI